MRKSAAAFFAILFLNHPLIAQDAPAKAWKEQGELTYLSTNGNSKTATTGLKNLFEYRWTNVALELTGGALGSENDGRVTAEQYDAGEKVSKNFSERNYVFEKYRWDKNRFAGIAQRHDASVGVGRELIKSDKDTLNLELGGGYINEQRIGSPRVDFASGRTYGKYVRTISKTSDFTQEGEYLHNFEDANNFRLNTTSALTASISTHFALKVSYQWKRVNEPPAGFGKNDTITALSLIANY